MEILVVGGGCIGLGIAGELAEDHSVTLLEEANCGQGATRAAAGMLAPVMEAEYGETELLDLCLESHRRYPSFVESLEDDTGIDVGFRTEGTLGLAFDQPGVSDLERQVDYLNRMDLTVEELSPEACRELEPRISSYVSKAIRVSSEYQVDNRRLAEALKERAKLRNVDLHERTPAETIRVENGSVQSVSTPKGDFSADYYLLCAGAKTGKIDGLPESDRMPIRPVKGQALSVQLSDPPEVEHVLRSQDVYCVPKDDGRLVVGATMEEEGYDTTVTAGAVLNLLHDAYEMVPFIYENELLETWAGLRPASRDSRPIIGPSTSTDNLGFASGHYRNGILLTPVTVQSTKNWLENGDAPELLEPFLPSRFQNQG
ncbi:MAG: glycine oxidase ThiO [bacterium]